VPAEKMIRLLKTFLLWLLMLVLPMQGMAAVTSCVNVQQKLHQRFDMASILDEHESHVIASTHHQQHAMSTGMDHEHATASDAAPHSHQKSADASCSVCAACCVNAAMASSGIDWHPPLTRSEFVDAPSSLFLLGVIPPTLDRPPTHRTV